MANTQKQLGLLKVLRVFLVNADGSRKVGITRLIRQMTITEDIFKNTLYGSVRIKDSVDLLGGMPSKKGTDKAFPIVGEEFLQIKFITDYTDQMVDLRFAVYGIEDIVYHNNNTKKEYTLNFCSEEHLIDATTVVMKKYSKQHSENIKDLCRDYLNLDDGSGGVATAVPAKKFIPPASNNTPSAPGAPPVSTPEGAKEENPINVSTQASTGTLGFPTNGSAIAQDSPPYRNKKRLATVQPTKGPQDLYVPKLSPLQTAEMMARRSIAEEKYESASYLFFENFEGFNFCDIEYLIAKGMDKVKKTPEVFTYHYENPLIRDTKKKEDPLREYKTLQKVDHVHYFDTVEKIKMGMFESDIIKQSHKSTRFRFMTSEVVNNTLTTGGLNGKSYPENSISFMKTVISEDDKANKYTRKFLIPKDLSDPNKDTYLDVIYTNRASYFTRLAQNVFTVTTYGDPAVQAGDVIKLMVPEGDGLDPKGASKVNPRLSGYFLVGTIKHVFTQTTYHTIMDIYKNAFGDAVLSTDEAEEKPPVPTNNENIKSGENDRDVNTMPADPTDPEGKEPVPDSAIEFLKNIIG